jgi:3-deoxy-D-manno-octulosonate 8-phosphate phosphatase KdsC-like HAD superfamily phosphatase
MMVQSSSSFKNVSKQSKEKKRKNVRDTDSKEKIEEVNITQTQIQTQTDPEFMDRYTKLQLELIEAINEKEKMFRKQENTDTIMYNTEISHTGDEPDNMPVWNESGLFFFFLLSLV